MPKRFLTYHAGNDGPRHTKSADIEFDDGVEVEMPAARDWLWWKLQSNPFFSSRVEIEEEKPAQDGEDTHPEPIPVPPELKPGDPPIYTGSGQGQAPLKTRVPPPPPNADDTVH